MGEAYVQKIEHDLADIDEYRIDDLKLLNIGVQ